MNDLRLTKIINECCNQYLINEAKKNKTSDVEFNKWKDIFDSYLTEMINELQTDYLNQFGLRIQINKNYIFSGGKSKWLASYEYSSEQIQNGIISIGINYPSLYSGMCKIGADKDTFNIEAQARITVGHEIGHGLVDFIKHLQLDKADLKQMPNIVIVRKCKNRQEEDLVEEFGEYQFPDATDCYDSTLCNALDELSNIVM